MRRRVLITVPGMSLPGGVTNYYGAMRLEDEPDIRYFEVNAEERRVIPRTWRLLKNYVRFFFLVPRYDTVLLNPSLVRNSFWRDALFAAIVRFWRRRLYVFWRGWSWNQFRTVTGSALQRGVFRHTFGGATRTIYLAREFEQAVEEQFGKHRGPTFIETTVADDAAIAADPDEGPPYAGNRDKLTLLFLSRMTTRKGVYIVLDVFARLREQRDDIELIMAGDGREYDNVRRYAGEKGIPDVTFTGYIYGPAKHELYKRADIFFFPTMYGEGMPNCVLEALCYGVPVVSRYNAGIPDVVTDEVHGLLTHGTEADDFYPLVKRLLDDPDLRQRMALAGVQSAPRFTAASVRKRLLALIHDDDPAPALATTVER